MKLWIDDVRTAPEGYVWAKTVNQAKSIIRIEDGLKVTGCSDGVELIDIDHDAGDYSRFGGDYIRLFDWLEETGRNYPIRIHSMNPVGAENMRAIIKRNGWREIK